MRKAHGAAACFFVLGREWRRKYTKEPRKYTNER